jgi:YHS domain-containing protein
MQPWHAARSALCIPKEPEGQARAQFSTSALVDGRVRETGGEHTMNTMQMSATEDGMSLDDGRTTLGVDNQIEAVQRDPVCGMEVIHAAAAASEPYRGVDYHFCSRDCKDKFVADPSHYVG